MRTPHPVRRCKKLSENARTAVDKSGVGCVTAIINGALRGTEPDYDSSGRPSCCRDSLVEFGVLGTRLKLLRFAASYGTTLLSIDSYICNTEYFLCLRWLFLIYRIQSSCNELGARVEETGSMTRPIVAFDEYRSHGCLFHTWRHSNVMFGTRMRRSSLRLLGVLYDCGNCVGRNGRHCPSSSHRRRPVLLLLAKQPPVVPCIPRAHCCQAQKASRTGFVRLLRKCSRLS